MATEELDEVVHRIMDSVLKGTEHHFRNELGIEFLSTKVSQGEIDALHLCNLTAFISIGGPVSALIAYGFDRSLAAYLLDIETAGLDIAEAERPQFQLDALAETINVVIGHITIDLTEIGNAVVLSPPVLR